MHSTGDTGTEVVIITWRIRTAQDLMAGVAAAEMDITAEAAVGEGGMVKTSTPTPPTKTERKLGAAVRTDMKEVGPRR